MEKRIASILILVGKQADKVHLNALLSGFAPLILSRQGINVHKDFSIINLIVEANNDQIGALSGMLGKLKDVRVKTASLKI